MHFVALIFFSVSCSFAFGDVEGVGPYYEEMKADDAINDDVGDNDQIETLNGDDDRNESVEDDSDQLDRTINAIKSSIEIGELDDSGYIDKKKLNAENIGIDDSNEAVQDGVDDQTWEHPIGSINGYDGVNYGGNIKYLKGDEGKKSALAGIKHNLGSDNDNDVIKNKKLNAGKIWNEANDETVLDANDNQMMHPSYIKNDPSKLSKPYLGNDELDVKQYQLELVAGDLSELLGNTHHQEQRYYKDLGRRFVPVYPYEKKKVKKHRKPKPEDFIRFVLSPKTSLRDNEDRDIVPIRAPPELVLAAMKNGTKKYASKPSEPTEEVIRQYMLRSGDYWDNVWKEEVVPSSPLRTKKQHKRTSDSQPITAKLVPGTKLYDLLADIVKKTPKLVYIINK